MSHRIHLLDGDPWTPELLAACSTEPHAPHDAIDCGGMGTVHFASLRGVGGATRSVAVKRVHGALAHDPEFASRFVGEARMASRISHPNIVQTLGAVICGGELVLVMDYVEGESLLGLMRKAREHGQLVPPRVAVAIIAGILRGLHAAHETRDEHGRDLGLVHRGVSPQNVLIGRDGVARVLGFGVSRALGESQLWEVDTAKGKLGYMAPEQLEGGAVTRRTDIYSTSAMLWELLTGERLFRDLRYRVLVTRVLAGRLPAPSQVRGGDLKKYDRVVLRGLAQTPHDRYRSALEMARKLEGCGGVASAAEVAAWLENLAALPPSDPGESVAQASLRRESGSAGGRSDKVNGTLANYSSGVGSPVVTRPRQNQRAWLRRAVAVLALAGLAVALAWWQAGRASRTEVPGSLGTQPRSTTLQVKPWISAPGRPAPAAPAGKAHCALALSGGRSFDCALGEPLPQLLTRLRREWQRDASAHQCAGHDQPNRGQRPRSPAGRLAWLPIRDLNRGRMPNQRRQHYCWGHPGRGDP